jgi:hypothetical protein
MRAHLPPGSAGDEAFLEQTLLADPWADPELPSLVAVDDAGAVVGSIASQARRLSFNGREIRAVCCSHLVVDPASRATAAGALLLGRLLGAGQDLTWSESADDIVVRIWRLSGGDLDAARAYDWMLVLRPGGWAGAILGGAARDRRVDRSRVPVGALPFHALVRGRVKERVGEDLEGVTGEATSPAEIAAEMPALNRGVRLYVDHDEQHLASLFSVIDGSGRRLVRRLVRRAGRPVGWYAYLEEDDGSAHVLHVGAARDRADAVLGDLVRHATESGTRVLSGRAEPHLLRPLRRRLAIFGVARQPVIHASDPELAAAAMMPSAQISRLDGEWFVT